MTQIDAVLIYFVVEAGNLARTFTIFGSKEANYNAVVTGSKAQLCK
jgi:hypothetical protein